MTRLGTNFGENYDGVTQDGAICVLTKSEATNENSSAVLDHLFSRLIHPPLKLEGFEPLNSPSVLIGITIDHSALFVPEFLAKVSSLDYPASKLDVFVACHSDKHLKVVQQWKEKSPFKSITLEDQNKGNYLYFFRLERAGRILLLGEARYTSFVVFFYLPPLGNLLHPTN